MSEILASQGDRVQLEQSDMHLASNMAKMAKGGFSHGAIEQTQYLIKNPRADVRDEKKRGVEYPGHIMVKAAIGRHQAMLSENLTDGCVSSQNRIVKNQQTRWRGKGTGASSPDLCRQPTPEPTPPLPRTSAHPGMPPPPPSTNASVPRFLINNLPASYMFSHTSLRCAEFLHLMHMAWIASTIQMLIQIW